MMYYSTHYSSPLGPLTLASDGEHLAGLWLEGQKYFGDTVSGDMEERDGLPLLAWEDQVLWVPGVARGRISGLPERTDCLLAFYY